MPTRTFFSSCVLAFWLALFGLERAQAGIDVRLSPPVRVALAQSIVLGKVTAVEKDTVEARPERGADKKVRHSIAVVQVEETLLGARHKQLQIGFVRPGKVKTGLIPYAVDLTVGQQGCFVLARHPEEDFLVVLGVGGARANVLSQQGSMDFTKEVEALRRYARLLQDPEASLRDKSREERALTAGMLLIRYRVLAATPGSQGRTEPIDAKESRLILEALADADWSRPGPSADLSPRVAFLRLGLTEKDGWQAPADPEHLPAAAKKWLGEHAGSYRIRRFVR